MFATYSRQLIAQKIREARVKSGLSQHQSAIYLRYFTANTIAFDRDKIYYIEKTGGVGGDELIAIALFYQLELQYFTGAQQMPQVNSQS